MEAQSKYSVDVDSIQPPVANQPENTSTFCKISMCVRVCSHLMVSEIDCHMKPHDYRFAHTG